MAEASIKFLLENLSSLIKGEIGLILGVNHEINKLSSNLATIQAVLQDAEDKQLENESIRDWLRKLSHLAFEIEDVLDESVTKLGTLEFQNRMSKSIKNIVYKWKIARKIKQVAGELDIVAAERAKFHLSETTVVLQNRLLPMRQTGSLLNAADLVIGRDIEREEIIYALLNKVRDVHELSVLAIIGIGGLGKTTLARLVFNDNRVTGHFDIKLWVCVSDDFDQKALIKAMLASATPSENTWSLEHLDALQQRLFQLLHQKRYLLVLDDVWNDNQEKWLNLKNQLACGKAGSSIIVTTREKKVADIMATIPTLSLNGLSEENCWLLFKERAFGHEVSEHAELEAIGRQIVNKCVGVPLAATTLGGLLRFERREEEWIRVKESPIWSLPQNESSILPALRLSYNHLPLTHRHCFAYCAVFPKDSRIKKEELILQWMAHGYISADGTSSAEEIGGKILNELILRSLILNVTTKDDEEISFFQMHDLVHDLAQSIMENKVPCGSQGTLVSRPMSRPNIRHVNLTMKYVAFPRIIVSDMDLFTIFLQFNRLRSLDASWSDIKDVPPAIGKLIQLRYLNLSNNEIKTLPEKLCNLWNLKILDLSDCMELWCLPRGMKKLRNLRRLFLEGCVSLSQMPPKIGELSSLKTLSIFIVGKERDNQIKELQLLDLGSNLTITHLEKVHEKYLDADEPILAKKRNLQHLKLQWETGDSSRCRESLDEKVLTVLDPHANVETLEIVGFDGKHIPLWMRSSTVQIKLVELYIVDCKNCVCLPQKVVVELPHLKKLELKRLSALEYIDEGCELARVKFPVLEELELSSLENLKGLLKNETGECFPNLQKLGMSYLPSLDYIVENEGRDLSRAKFPMLEVMELYHLENLKGLLKNETGECFPRLKKLVLCNLPALEYIVEDEGCDFARVTFPVLVELDLWALENLKGLLKKEAREFFPSLQKLYIDGCSSLLSLPQLSSLVDLSCKKKNITSVGGNKFENLSTLHVSMDAEDVSVPKECLTNNLKSLTIRNADEDSLPEEGLQRLKSLEGLIILSERLTCLPGRWLSNLTSLEVLRLHDCYEMVEIAEEIKYLHNLKELVLDYLPKLVCLPDGLQHCTALQSLSLFGLKQIQLLPDWFGNFKSLTYLSVDYCPKVVSIPSTIQNLPQLNTLKISGCPDLKKRCEKGNGEDWHKIAHIPNTRIIE